MYILQPMNWLLYGLIGVVLIIAFLAWGFLRITRRTADAAKLIRTVEAKDISDLVQECRRVCSEKLGTTLKLGDLENSAQALDYVLEPKQRTRMKTAFEIPGHSGRFVLPLGAFIGELVRTHNPESRWVSRSGGGLAMDIPQGTQTLTMHPFDKVLKHAATGEVGEILAYIQVAVGNQSKL